MFPTTEKRLWTKAKAFSFYCTENKFPVAGMNDSLKNMFSRYVFTFGGSNVWKEIGENGLR